MADILTFKLRLRDKHASELNRQARAVNSVWNYCNETQQKAAQSGRQWLNNIELERLTNGAAREVGLHSHTIRRVCRQYDTSRRQKCRPWLRWRGRRSLGWVPFNTGHVRFDGEAFWFRGHRYEPMHLRDGLEAGMRFGAGSFNQDSRGRWYINVPVKVERRVDAPDAAAGMDLGLKELATLSDGRKIEAPQFYRKSEMALATAQRARKTKRARAIHRRAANRRKDFLHKASAALAEEYGLIVVGDVSPSKLARTRMAKSVHDAGWSDFKRMLSYKTHLRGGRTIEVPEQLTSQSCSECGALPASRPTGIAGLRIREWECDDCGAAHDRDVNAARNILRIGLDTLAEGAAA